MERERAKSAAIAKWGAACAPCAVRTPPLPGPRRTAFPACARCATLDPRARGPGEPRDYYLPTLRGNGSHGPSALFCCPRRSVASSYAPMPAPSLTLGAGSRRPRPSVYDPTTLPDPNATGTVLRPTGTEWNPPQALEPNPPLIVFVVWVGWLGLQPAVLTPGARQWPHIHSNIDSGSSHSFLP